MFCKHAMPAVSTQRRHVPAAFLSNCQGTPLHIKGQPKPDPASIKRELITNETIYDCIAAPHPEDINIIKDTLLCTADVTSCLNVINTLKANKGLALVDIITTLNADLEKIDVPPQTRVTWLEGLAEIEYRLSGGGSEVIQTGGMVGAVRNGVDLMVSSDREARIGCQPTRSLYYGSKVLTPDRS